MGGEYREKREERQRGARRKGRKIKKSNMPRRTQSIRNKKLRKETSEGGQTKLLPSPGVGAAEQMRRWAHRQAGPPQRGRRPCHSPFSVVGAEKGPDEARAGKLGAWPGIRDPQEYRAHPHPHPVPGSCTHLNLGHQGALSCQCWAGGTRCWALTEAPCHPQGSANRRRVSQHALRWLDCRSHRTGCPEDSAHVSSIRQGLTRAVTVSLINQALLRAGLTCPG